MGSPATGCQEHLPPPSVTTKTTSRHRQLCSVWGGEGGGTVSKLLRSGLGNLPSSNHREAPPASLFSLTPCSHSSPSQGHIRGVLQWGRSSTRQSGRLSSLLCHESELKLGQRVGTTSPHSRKLWLILLLYCWCLVECPA